MPFGLVPEGFFVSRAVLTESETLVNTKPKTILDIQRMKEEGEKIAVLTAYDFPFARLMDLAGIDMILVGDSAGSVVAGYDTTLPVTMDEMVYHTKAVARGTSNALIIADMPFLSYQIDVLYEMPVLMPAA